MEFPHDSSPNTSSLNNLYKGINISSLIRISLEELILFLVLYDFLYWGNYISIFKGIWVDYVIKIAQIAVFIP